MSVCEPWLDDLKQWPTTRQLADGLLEGRTLSLRGVIDPVKPILLASLRDLTQRPILAIACTPKRQAQLLDDCLALMENTLSFPEASTQDEQTIRIPDPESTAILLQSLRALSTPIQSPRVIVTTASALSQKIPSPETLKAQRLNLKVGQPVDRELWLEELVHFGFESSPQVSQRGQFSKRGGILDLFPMDSEAPFRLEWDGDRIDSIRSFDLDSQRSIQMLESIDLSTAGPTSTVKTESQLPQHLPSPYLIWKEDPNRSDEVHIQLSTGSGQVFSQSFEIYSHDFARTASLDPVLLEQRHLLLLELWKGWGEMNWRVVVSTNNEGEERRLKEILKPDLLPHAPHWIQTSLSKGFVWPAARFVLLTDAEIFGRYQDGGPSSAGTGISRARARARREAIDFSEFQEGEYVVHVHHGIGRFRGIQVVDISGKKQEVLSLEYDQEALLHVPIEQSFLVGRYVGVGKFKPSLDQLGGSRWGKAAAQAQKSVLDYAAHLLKVQAQRQFQTGFAFAKDSEWQKEFEDSFLYQETPDQITAIAETKEDMESHRPMDRLICGDVGFGKTEVAIRAAFKAVMNGLQVAVLAPTTVLAQQHERTFRERMADYPIRIDLISRFRKPSQIRKSLAAATEGKVDILIGTHRLLQPDVEFKKLGLVVVDEEQRFGVKHKERFKDIFKLVDILTLSATPIPRTLYQSLVGAKDISTIETPPPNRLPVETTIAPYDERLIRTVIERELARGGQVYHLHNRIESIQKVRDRIKELVPTARVEFGHGQMHEHELEGIMMRFVAGEIDVLVATTIIESGLDIPRANTIIIDRADRFGLADLYQLRGRVGRGKTKAYAYLLLPRHLMIEADARKRVSAIKQYSQLGAGFKIAMRDLEIRGAGNILGTEQSGHATAIGFELYCQLLKETLARMKGERIPKRIEVKLHLDFLPLSENQTHAEDGAYIPKAYMPESRQRIEGYRKLAEAFDEKSLKELFDQWRDRYGKWPPPVAFLYEVSKIRLQASSLGVSSIEAADGKLMVKKKADFVLVGSRFPRLVGKTAKAKLSEIQKFLTSLKPFSK